MYSLLIKHDYSHNDINHRKKMKRIILANLNGHKLSFLLKLSAAARPKRKETDLWVHALFEIAPVFLSFPFFSFYFLSYLFSFGSCFVSFFHSENVLCFRSPFIGHGNGLFIAPAMASVLRSCPLIAFV